MVARVVGDFIGLYTIKDVTCRIPDLYLSFAQICELNRSNIKADYTSKKENVASLPHANMLVVCCFTRSNTVLRLLFCVYIPCKYGVSAHFREMCQAGSPLLLFVSQI